MSMLSELLPEDRPRERLMTLGAERLAAGELLALVLGTGRGSGEDALELAERLLREIGGVERLASAGIPGLTAVDGIGPVKAARIVAALELARRVAGAPAPAAPETEAPPADPLAVHAQRLRGQVPAGERAVLGVRADGEGEPVTLALGEGIGPQTRPGALLVRLLAAGPGPWFVAVLRPGGPPTPRERDAADRVLSAAALLGVRVARVLVVAGRSHWLLAEEAP